MIAVATLRPFDGGTRVLTISLGLAGLGIIGSIGGFWMQPREMFVAYLIAWWWLATIALGAMVFLQSCHAMNAAWPTVIRRPIEAIMSTLPLLTILFIPLLFANLWPFLHPDRVTDPVLRGLLEHKLGWLNRPMFVARSLGYLVVWSVLAWVLRGLSLRLDTPGHDTARGTLKLLSAATLPLVGLTLTFASFDWIMALSPDFFSTVFGIYNWAGGFVAAIALSVLVVAGARPWLPPISRSHWYAFGRLLLAFVIFWGYIAYFQFFLIWIANKPIEARWYVDRIHGPYRPLSWVIGLGQFGIPFFALLPFWIKQTPARLAPIAVLLLFTHYFDVYWLIAPTVGHGPSFSDLSAFLALTGLTIAFGVWRQRGHLLVPIHDPRYQAGLAYQSK